MCPYSQGKGDSLASTTLMSRDATTSLEETYTVQGPPPPTRGTCCPDNQRQGQMDPCLAYNADGRPQSGKGVTLSPAVTCCQGQKHWPHPRSRACPSILKQEASNLQ